MRRPEQILKRAIGIGMDHPRGSRLSGKPSRCSFSLPAFELVLLLSLSLAGSDPLSSQELFTHELSIEADGDVETLVDGTLRREAVVRLRSRRLSAPDAEQRELSEDEHLAIESAGVEAWTLGIVVDGGRIESVSTGGTESECSASIGEDVGADCFVHSHIVESGRGVVFGAIPGTTQAVRLSPVSGPHDLLRLTLLGDPAIDSRCDTLHLRFDDRLRGGPADDPGPPVRNLVTAEGASRTPRQRPTALAWRPADCSTSASLDDAIPSAVFSFALTPCRPRACFEVTAPVGDPLLLALEPSTRGEEAFVLRARWGSPPDATNFDERIELPRLHRGLLIAAARAQTLFVELDGGGDVAPDTSITLRASRLDAAIDSVTPDIAVRGVGRVGIVVRGAGFVPGTTRFRLRRSGASPQCPGVVTPGTDILLPVATTVLTADRAELRFDLSSLPAAADGNWALDAWLAGGEGGTCERLLATHDDALRIESALREAVGASLRGLARNGRGRDSELTLELENLGNAERDAPLLIVRAVDLDSGAADDVALWLAGDSAAPRSELALLAAGSEGLAGRFSPGRVSELPIRFRAASNGRKRFDVLLLEPTASRSDCANLLPPDETPDWDSLCPQYAALTGSSFREQNAWYAEVSTRLARRGAPAASLAELSRFTARLAISERTSSAVVGRVVDETTADPITDRVVVARREGDPVSSALSDEEGRFAIVGLEPGATYTLAVDERTPSSNDNVTLPADGDLYGVVLETSAGGTSQSFTCKTCDLPGLPGGPVLPARDSFVLVPVASFETRVVAAVDPNEKDGPEGEPDDEIVGASFGPRFVGAGAPLRYRISFENTGDAAARRVEIVDRLGDALDPSTLRLRSVSFGIEAVNEQTLPLDLHARDLFSGSGEHSACTRALVLDWQDPERCWIVDVQVAVVGREIRWTLNTLEPTDCFVARICDDWPEPSFDDFEAGFLPPEPRAAGDPQRGRGQGSVSFDVSLLPGLAEEEPIQNDAAITFDDRRDETLSTDEVLCFSEFLPAELPGSPSPVDGEVEHGVRSVFSWTPALSNESNALLFDVLLWTEAEWAAGAPPTLAARVLDRPTADGETRTRWLPPQGLLEPGAQYRWQVVSRNRRGEAREGSPLWRFATRADKPPLSGFQRGDADGSGRVELTDAVFVLRFLFLDGSTPGCHKSADADDNGVLQISDGIAILAFLFLGGDPLPGPFPDCGVDPTEDGLSCDEISAQCS